MIRQEQKRGNNQKLPVGEYEVVEIPKGRRIFVLVKKAGSSDIYRFFFRRFMGCHYPLGTVLRSDGNGEIEIDETAREQESESGLKNGPIGLSKCSSGIYITVGELEGNRTKAVIVELGDDYIVMRQISFSSFLKRYCALGNTFQSNGIGGTRALG